MEDTRTFLPARSAWAWHRAAILAGLLSAAAPLQANVNVALRPAAQTACIGDSVEIGLYLVSDDATDQTVGSIEIIVLWNSAELELSGKVDNGPYVWMSSEFPDDSALDGLNAPFSGPTPFVPDNDGTAFYVAWAPFAPSPPALATPAGLLATTLVFRTLAPGSGQIGIPQAFGNYAVTACYDGETPGLDVTGVILPPVSVEIQCTPPAMSAAGSRYLAVAPEPCGADVALWLTGDPGDTATACMSKYVQPDGSLDATPVFQSPASWGSFFLRDESIRPGTSYQVLTECDLGGGATAPSAPSTATTWIWGDVNHTNMIDLDDILLVLDGFQGMFPSATRENVDLFPCSPDGRIDLDDILGVLDAFRGLRFPDECPTPCP